LPTYKNVSGKREKETGCRLLTGDSHLRLASDSNASSMVEDNNLDHYNSLLMAYLFENDNHHLKDEAPKTENARRVRSAVAKLPDGIGTSFDK